MRFCETCGNMYYLKIDKSETNVDLLYYCRNCGSETTCNDESTLLISRNTKKKNVHLHYFVNKYTKFDPTIPRINYMSCVSKECKSNTDVKTEKDILYIKYDRENLKYLYMCCLCDTIWDNNMNAIKFDVD
jgi:DNA-directed RNA polymerase subunit M/transcription elongation factor TFIIS